jgi:antitoxin PrlF
MEGKTYPILKTEVSDEDAFHLPSSILKDYPHLINALGYIEVLSDSTLLIRFDVGKNGEEEDQDESLMMKIFLDFLMKDAMKNPSKLVPYTQEMSDEIENLLADVVLDE